MAVFRLDHFVGHELYEHFRRPWALRTNKWQDQQGQDRYRTEIIGNEMQMLDTRQQDQGGQQGGYQQGGQQQGGYQQQAPQNNAPQQPRQGNAPANQQRQSSPHQNTPHSGDFQNNQGQNQQSQQSAAPNFDDFDDDIPFFNPYKGKEYLV